MWRLRRRVARVVLLDEDDRVFLINSRDPGRPGKTWWELPGGGIDGAESPAEAAMRELYEEAGITDAEISRAPVWQQYCEFDFAMYRFEQDELIYLARGPHTEEIHPAGLEALESQARIGWSWVPAGQLGELAAESRIIPGWLPQQVLGVLEAGVPAQPIDLGSFIE